ncbi:MULTISPECIES: STAS domain-containing protein [unclassified Anabaena]|uniref:STAS domain-containing protein n=1 Tax=unclassified Anabaena TaxID=2619674 RepID=UPI001445BCAA|nr:MULTISPECIES: STAS domain-containing protein [unclassified Anabaena]MTJ08313.1 STAS domain-containing protein [Anabaena sp. UHCC 0204]MTJ51586.1 STAS domain-containing protein [Anabaena sp. UHCC 0253]
MNDQVKVITLSSSFNTNDLQEFQQTIQTVISSGIKTVLVDCQGITFMDSSGLGTLVLTFKTLQEADIKMVLCSINEQVRMLFELTGMDSIFTIIPSKDAFNNLSLSATLS